MPTRILLVRHGATRLTLEDRFAGSNDEPLSAGNPPINHRSEK